MKPPTLDLPTARSTLADGHSCSLATQRAMLARIDSDLDEITTLAVRALEAEGERDGYRSEVRRLLEAQAMREQELATLRRQVAELALAAGVDA